MYKFPWVIVTESMDWFLGKHFCAHTSPLISSPFIPLNHSQHTLPIKLFLAFWFWKSVQARLPCPCFLTTRTSQKCTSTVSGFSSRADVSAVSCAVASCSTHILKACELLCVRTSNAVYLINRGKKSAWGRTGRDALSPRYQHFVVLCSFSSKPRPEGPELTTNEWIRSEDYLADATEKQLNKDWPCVVIYSWYSPL